MKDNRRAVIEAQAAEIERLRTLLRDVANSTFGVPIRAKINAELER